MQLNSIYLKTFVGTLCEFQDSSVVKPVIKQDVINNPVKQEWEISVDDGKATGAEAETASQRHASVASEEATDDMWNEDDEDDDIIEIVRPPPNLESPLPAHAAESIHNQALVSKRKYSQVEKPDKSATIPFVSFLYLPLHLF